MESNPVPTSSAGRGGRMSQGDRHQQREIKPQLVTSIEKLLEKQGKFLLYGN